MDINQAKVIRDGAKTECNEALGALQVAVERDLPALLATLAAVVEHVGQVEGNAATILGGGIETEEVKKAHGMADQVKQNIEAMRDKGAGEIAGNAETVRQRIVSLIHVLDEV